MAVAKVSTATRKIVPVEVNPDGSTAAEEVSGDPILVIRRIPSETMLVPIRGNSPLIVSRFSEKAKQMMLDAQQGRKRPKEPRNPEAEYQNSLYAGKNKQGELLYGFPVTGFKAATVAAARFYGKDVKMTELRQFIFMRGRFFPEQRQQLTVIDGTPVMREDYVRLAGAGRPADLRYRGEFADWRAVLEVTYVSSMLSRDSVLSLIDAGGMGVGVGEWRPEHRGEFGTYTLDEDRSQADVEAWARQIEEGDR